MSEQQTGPRVASIKRDTKETQIELTLNLDGCGDAQIDTGVGFFDHMLTHIARHGLFDLTVKATGDIHVDFHHLVEDVGIVLGSAIAAAIGDKRGLVRYGMAGCPMDEALVLVAIDLSGRPWCRCELEMPTQKIGDFDTELLHEFFVAVANNAAMALHLVRQSGINSHHIAEGAFKSFARALDAATTLDPRVTGVPSTKGTL
ncbi:MAG: imidazoleglycerol-phosphate dehydratase HisB [candidate division WS1 bacterium]|jgi:imidazoleglycerol-phosphate dehydratase|nr:imidazoleglycerol-phosphate dehydratase HisB [candidate division WS1 bacterium]